MITTIMIMIIIIIIIIVMMIIIVIIACAPGEHSCNVRIDIGRFSVYFESVYVPEKF